MSINDNFYPLTPQQANKLRKAKLTAAEWRIWSYLVECDPWGDRYQDLDTFTAMSECDVSKATFYRAIAKFQEEGLLPEWVKVREVNTIEKQIRDRLQSQLGGLTEVVTPAGLFDLLTQTEIIEVKHLSEWKSAMGQILAYSGFYPEHRKRIHLFGKNDEAVIATAMAICLELDITVAFEEVE